jgi:hypothetical protein
VYEKITPSSSTANMPSIMVKFPHMAGADQVAVALVEKIWYDLLADCHRPERLLEEFSFWLKARENRLDCLSRIIGTAMQPRPRDWIARPLPYWMYPVYYLMRPVRLVREYGGMASA